MVWLTHEQIPLWRGLIKWSLTLDIKFGENEMEQNVVNSFYNKMKHDLTYSSFLKSARA